MNMNTIYTVLLLILFFFCGELLANDIPLKISEICTKNQIVEFKQQKLILIDFWATWCGPCKPASKQLEILQEHNQSDVFAVAITDETHETVMNYIKRNPIQISVMRDIGGNLIRQFNVGTRPYSVILNTKGELIWRGHPSGINNNLIQKLAQKHSSFPNIQLHDLFEIIEPEKHSAPEKEINEVDFMIKKNISQQSPLFKKEKNSVEYKGSLFGLIAKIYNVPNQLIIDRDIQDFSVHFSCPAETWETKPDTVLNLISNSLNIKLVPETGHEEVYLMEVVDESKLWDIKQIEWGNNNESNYLIGENRMQADNMKIADLCIILSNTTNKIFKYFGDNTKEHDWNFHFRFDELMESELLNEFGISIKKKEVMVTRFFIQ